MLVGTPLEVCTIWVAPLWRQVPPLESGTPLEPGTLLEPGAPLDRATPFVCPILYTGGRHPYGGRYAFSEYPKQFTKQDSLILVLPEQLLMTV